MPLRIHFARHGESQANLLHEISNRGLKHGLTLKGRQQAFALAGRFQGHPIAQIYSSPLLRAIETSVILAAGLELGYEITDALREYDCGILEGRSDAAAWDAWQRQFDAWTLHHRSDECIQGGESLVDMRARFEPFIAALASRHSGANDEVICVSHGGLYKLVLPLLVRNINAAFLVRSEFKNTDWLTVELRPDGLYALEWNGEPLELGG